MEPRKALLGPGKAESGEAQPQMELSSLCSARLHCGRAVSWEEALVQEHQSGWVQEGRWDRARAVFPLSHCHGEQLGEQSCLPGFSTTCTCPLLCGDVGAPCLQQRVEVHTLTEKGHEPCCHHQPL